MTQTLGIRRSVRHMEVDITLDPRFSISLLNPANP